ncbi:hypothetical protein LAZ67_12003338 [Cordylochernes scorpioides]|uniref:BTB domain-containing protein n=1 Tax=Cordylochernes scorpioides TaxID=51811 RepID=A0ABY6L4S4_9ARAC|nr:hypothetical protein LAZ67_12003338 [Cordylochernes scorpioides]
MFIQNSLNSLLMISQDGVEKGKMRNFSDTGESKENSRHQVRRIKEYEESFHHARLGTHTRKLWLQKHYMDIHILVQGRTFPAHKAVLTCYCPFLKKQLLSPTRFNVKTVRHFSLQL